MQMDAPRRRSPSADDATGEYIVEAYRSDELGLSTQFTVTVDPLLPKATRLEKISGDDQTGLTGGVWAAPFVVEVLDQYDAPLEGARLSPLPSSQGVAY